MTQVFDGVAGLLTGVFGATISVTPTVGDPFDIDAVFREVPVEMLDAEGGGALDMVCSVQVPKSSGRLSVGDVVAPSIAPGRSFRVINGHPNGSPAVDGFIVHELEEILE